MIHFCQDDQKQVRPDQTRRRRRRRRLTNFLGGPGPVPPRAQGKNIPVWGSLTPMILLHFKGLLNMSFLIRWNLIDFCQKKDMQLRMPHESAYEDVMANQTDAQQVQGGVPKNCT